MNGAPNLNRTIDWAKQHKIPVTIFGPVPEYDGHYQAC